MKIKLFILISLAFICVTANAYDRCPKGQASLSFDVEAEYPTSPNWRGWVCLNWAYDESKVEGYFNRVENHGRNICSKISELESGERILWRGSFPTRLWVVIYKFKCKDPSLNVKQEPSASPNSQSNPENQFKRSFEESKSTCLDLGFISGTEAFGKCVLQLTK